MACMSRPLDDRDFTQIRLDESLHDYPIAWQILRRK